MISEQCAVGWLCMVGYHLDQDQTVLLPAEVEQELRRRGWVAIDDHVSWDGNQEATLTEAGEAVWDLNAADWGIELKVFGEA